MRGGLAEPPDGAQGHNASVCAASQDAEARALVAEARAQASAGDHQGALCSFERAIGLAPDLSPALMGAGWACRSLGRQEDALGWFTRAREANPRNPMPAVREAQQLRMVGRLEEGLIRLHDAVGRFPEDPAPLVALASMRQEDGDWLEAIAAPRKALAIDSERVSTGVRLSELLTLTGREQEALEVTSDLLVHQPSSALIWQRLRARQRLGTVTESLGDIQFLDVSTSEGASLAAEIRAEVAFSEWDISKAVQEMTKSCDLEGLPRRWARLSAMQLAAADPGSAGHSRRMWAEAIRARRRNHRSDRGVRSSQGLLGDILNEYLLDPVATNQARESLADDDIEAACRTVIDFPGSLAAATTLLVVMRRRGALGPATPRTIAGSIPRVIVQAWFGGPMPGDVVHVSQRWKEAHPDWDHIVFDDESGADFLAEHHGVDAVRAIRSARHPAAKADLFRLAYLSVEGGVWVDADDGPVTPLDELVTGRRLVLWQEDRGSLGNNLLGSCPGHPAITLAWRDALQSIRDSYTESTWLATGPGLITRAIALWIAVSGRQQHIGADTLVLDPASTRRYLKQTRPLSYKGTLRSWQVAEQGGAAQP